MFPLCLGRVMTNRLALIFVWGIIFVDDLSYVPPDLTFFYGVISVAFVVGPLLLVLVREWRSSVFLAIYLRLLLLSSYEILYLFLPTFVSPCGKQGTTQQELNEFSIMIKRSN